MLLNVKTLGLAVTLVLTGSLKARASAQLDPNYLTLKAVRVNEVSVDVFNQQTTKTISQKNFNTLPGLPMAGGQVDPTEKVGKVIQTAKDLVALGEDIYRLVTKGRPSNTTSYAPLSIIPNVGGQPADILDTENWQDPKKVTYEIVYENTYGMDVVKFRYSVIWAYGGSYDGKGMYITAAQIIPESVNTLFGYDFTATMKLGGIQNKGTRANPVAGATLLLEYTVKTFMQASMEVSSHFIMGDGKYKKL